MKKIFIPCLLAAALVTSCANDEIVEQRQSAQISYAPAVTSASRGITTTANIQEFVVDGYLTTDTKSSIYVDHNTYNKKDGKWVSNATYFWPYTGSIDFYSFSPVSIKDKVVYKESEQGRQVILQNYEVSTLNSNYEDPVYAVAADKSHLNGSDLLPVPLNFKHILSQIVFNIKNTNPALVVDVQEVRIANLASKGTYTLTNETTVLQGGPVGSWTLDEKIAGGKVYDAYISGVDNITPESGVVSLSTPEQGSMLLLPQTANAWDPKNDRENEAFGSYILVKCRVWALIAGEKTLLWPTTNNTAGEIIYREVAIPVDIAWEQGKRYTYTLVFGEGAGYIPPTDTDPGDEVNLGNGDKVLKAITYDIKVDDYTVGSDQEIDSVK